VGGRWSLSYALGGQLEAPRRTKRRAASEEEWVKRLMEEFDAEELPPEWSPSSDSRAVADRSGGPASGVEGG